MISGTALCRHPYSGNFHKLPCILQVCPRITFLITVSTKKWQGYPCRLFFLCTIFGLKPTRMISPQCLHFISSTTFPGGLSSMSKMRRPHFGFGHFTFSIDHRLPALICNKGTKQGIIYLCLSDSLYPLCIICFLSTLSSYSPSYTPLQYSVNIYSISPLYTYLQSRIPPLYVSFLFIIAVNSSSEKILS